MINSEKVGGKIWSSVILFGLFGQIAWVIENMYFNVFLYNTLSKDTNAIAIMVAASAVTATLTTIFMGILSDKLGKRKLFMAFGYILWGISIAAFSLVKTEYLQKSFKNAALAGIILVIILDCVMTFFGSTANDASFNAWVTDNVKDKNRGKVEGVIAILPLLAVLLVFGGFDGLTKNGNWSAFFIIIGAIVTAGGIFGLFFVKDSPALSKGKDDYFKNLLYGFKPSTIKENKELYITLSAIGIFGIVTQIYMPYLIIYMTEYLKLESYALILGLIILIASVCSVLFGRLVDKFGKRIFLFPSVAAFIVGLLLMYFVKSVAALIPIGILMMASNLLFGTIANSDMREKTPKDKAGLFQGIRMIFFVLIPMVTGPFIGSSVIKQSETYLNEFGETVNVPNNNIFLAAAIAGILILVPVFFMYKNMKAAKKDIPN